MYDTIRASRATVKIHLCQIHKVTQWKDGCVYRTKSLGILSCTQEYAESICGTNPNLIVVAIPTYITNMVWA